MKINTMKYLLLLCLFLPTLHTTAAYLIVPMDRSQQDQLRAYGVAYQCTHSGQTVQWLLNYRGGSFLMVDNESNRAQLATQGVNYEILSDTQAGEIIHTVLAPNSSMNIIALTHSPRIAVYSPPVAKPYDDAVTMALSYAGIPYTTIYDREVLQQDLNVYDWIHVHHEDFTGQLNKWDYFYNKADWYIAEKKSLIESAHSLSFTKISQLKGAVAKKLRSYVEQGGQLFAMCNATDKLDIALATDGIDIANAEVDGDGVDATANQKLRFDNTFAFQKFTVTTDPLAHDYSPIAVLDKDMKGKDGQFTLTAYDAQRDLTAAMLTQSNTVTVADFMGQTCAFRTAYLKPDVTVLGRTATDAKYIYGKRGRGTFTFYAGHDPEDYAHYVGDAPTRLDQHKQSAGYRLILNNILYPMAANATLGLADAGQTQVNIYPNPYSSQFTIEWQSADITEAHIRVYSLTGQLAMTDDWRGEAGVFRKQYEGAALATGLYIVEISNAKGLIAKSLLTRVE